MQFFIALIVAVGAGTWIYGRVNKSNGGNNVKASLIASGISGGLIFLVVFYLAVTFLK
jgi:hypothetical protein